MRPNRWCALAALVLAVPALAQPPVPAAAHSVSTLSDQTPIAEPPKPPELRANQVGSLVVDIATREGVTQRFLYLNVEKPKASVVLFAGGHGGLRIQPDGRIEGGRNNFLVRSRVLFARYGLAVAVIDAPSDRQAPPYLEGARDSADHLADVAAVIAWLRAKSPVPVWLIGTSRGTQSVGHFATEVPRAAGGPDGIVLTSSMMQDRRSRALPEMALERIAAPVLVVHHKDDACRSTLYEGVPAMMERFKGSKRRALITAEGGRTQGDPCEAHAYHGFNGLETKVVSAIAEWILMP